MPSTRSPTSTIQFNEQVVTKYTRGGVTSTMTGNLGGADNTRPSSSLPLVMLFVNMLMLVAILIPMVIPMVAPTPVI